MLKLKNKSKGEKTNKKAKRLWNEKHNHILFLGQQQGTWRGSNV